MAYDSASDTALASQAYKRALAIAQQKRDSLNTSFGLNADGSLDNSSVGQLGSIYQGNLQSVTDEQGAQTADRRRGFGARGGLGGKATAAAHRIALQRQALGFQNATQQLGQNTQEQQLAGQDYEDQKSQIGSRSAFDLAQTLAANPVLGQPAPPPVASVAQPGIPPSVVAAQIAALKKNPRATQTARNQY